MNKPDKNDILVYAGIALAFCVVLQAWGPMASFVGIVLTAIVPLLLGSGIAYVVAIPTKFLERHFFPNSTSGIIEGMRKPVCLVVTVIMLVMGGFLSVYILVPGFVDTIVMVQKNGQSFVEGVIQLPIMEPVRDTIHDFIQGDLVNGFANMDIKGMIKTVFGGTVGSITTQVFTVVSSVMTAFFGMLFSFILLTDTTEVGYQIMNLFYEYLGPKRTERIALVLGVADSSFHNFIVRQCVEALILGSVATIVLFLAGFPYALGVGVLMGLAALVPIVGYPVGLILGAFMVAINNVWCALLYVLCVAVAQMLEATFVLPHVGDPRTVLPPVWVTVGVTIGGGVGGFLGMLMAIPIASTIRQLVVIDMKRRKANRQAKHLAQ
ncbi:MAG: AI-2E family transporter [Coriobacteriales bacterium]|nr:AI-2E family transporter [Coriobacteriales bacterium]